MVETLFGSESLGKWASRIALSFVLFCAPLAATGAQPIQFPDNELAAESVLPVFDQPDSVKNRVVVTARRVELGLMGGYSLTEPFFNPLAYGLTGSYHINEDHAVNMYGQMYIGGPSDYAKQLNPIPRTTINANLQLAPEPKYLFLPSYQYTGYYGKLSITKEFIMNLSLYGLAGVGMIGLGDASKPVGSVGLGQKFYLGSNFALRFDLRLLVYQGPDILSRSLQSETTTQPASSFEQKIQYGSLISFGAVYLLPQF